MAVATKYATDVVEGRIPASKLVVGACRRHLEDLERSKGDWPFRLDPNKAGRICRFVETLPHIKGDWSKRGERIKLQPPQVFIYVSVWGWVHKKTGLRRFRRAYVEWPRKNAKSTTAAGAGLFMGVADAEAGAEVYCGATSEKQAWEVFKPIKLMVQRTPELQSGLGVEPLAASVVQMGTASKIEPVIGKPGDGSSPSMAIVDEYHEHLTDELYDTMQTGMGARSQPLMFVITTAGVDLEGPCYRMHLDAADVLEGRVTGETADEFFALVYGLDEGDDWKSEAALWKANPLAGVSVDMDYLRSQQRLAILNPRKSGIFRTKHLNQWVTARSPFFDIGAWAKAGKCSWEDLAGWPVIGFIDLASKKDLAAMVMVGRKGGIYRAASRYWLPEDRVDEVKSARYRAWSEAGHLRLTPGNLIDFAFIEKEIVELRDKLDLRELAYDPFQATYLVTRLQEQGLSPVQCGVTVQNFSEPMKELDALVLAGKLEHDHNPVTGWCMSNVVVKQDAKDNVFPRKEREENKIDGAVALIGAVGRWLSQPEEMPSRRFFMGV